MGSFCAEDFVRAVLEEEMGFAVDKLAERQEKTPDFLVSKDDDHYLIEVKAKRPSDELASEQNRELRSGGVYKESHPLTRQSGITKIVSEAKDQLSAGQNDTDSRCQVLCFVGLGHNAQARLAQIEAGLFGSRTVTDWTTDDGPSRTCYYFSFSDFHRYRASVDGALLLNAAPRPTGRLAVNHHSPRYERMRDSSIVTAFGPGVIDPLRLEAKGEAWIVESAVDSQDESAVLEHVRQKYSLGKRVTVMTMGHHSASVLVPKS